jgi:hypothetical protein
MLLPPDLSHIPQSHHNNVTCQFLKQPGAGPAILLGFETKLEMQSCLLLQRLAYFQQIFLQKKAEKIQYAPPQQAGISSAGLHL